MKRGAKRPVHFDSATDPSDVDLGSKRVMETPSFADQRVESSHQQSREGPPLDATRAKLALQHVRALNKQFASWVQSQTQNHLDELWEDGLKDYLSHASNIMEGFKDIVEWLRANAAKSQSTLPTTSPGGQAIANSTLQTVYTSQNAVMPSSFLLPKSDSKQDPILHTNQGNSIFETKGALSYPSPRTNFAPSDVVMPSSFSIPQTSSLSFTSQSRLNSNTNNGFPQLATSATLPTTQSSILSSSSQSLGFFTNSGTQSPTFPGIQNSTSEKLEASDDADEGETRKTVLFVGWILSSISLKNLEWNQISVGHMQEIQLPAWLVLGARLLAGSLDLLVQCLFGDVIRCFYGLGKGELEQPSSPSLKKTEEEGVVIVHEAKCKVYIKPENPADSGWQDMGTGNLSIKCKEGVEKATKESKPTIIVRNDVGRILLNALLYPGIKMNIQKTSIVSIFHTTGGGQVGSSVVARTYLLRLKSAEDTTKLAQTIQEYAPST